MAPDAEIFARHERWMRVAIEEARLAGRAGDVPDLQSAGVGVSFGIATGKDTLILTPLRDLLELAQPPHQCAILTGSRHSFV